MFAINGIIQFNSKDAFLIERERVFQRQFNRQLKIQHQRSWGNDQQNKYIELLIKTH